MHLYKKDLTERYSVTVTEYNGNYYLHIRDTLVSKLGRPKFLTLHWEAVQSLTTLWEEITDTVKKEQNTALAKLQEDDEHILESLNSEMPSSKNGEENDSDEGVASPVLLGEKRVKKLNGNKNGPVKTKTRRIITEH